MHPLRPVTIAPIISQFKCFSVYDRRHVRDPVVAKLMAQLRHRKIIVIVTTAWAGRCALKGVDICPIDNGGGETSVATVAVTARELTETNSLNGV